MADLNEKLKQDKTGMTITMLALLCLILPSAGWTGFVLFKLYGWFILPIQGAPVVTLGNMLGGFSHFEFDVLQRFQIIKHCYGESRILA